jgi:hypothetical protein
METLHSEASDFAASEFANVEDQKAGLLAFRFHEKVAALRSAGEANGNALSLDATYENGDFVVRVSFSENYAMTVIYCRDANNETVGAIYDDSPDAGPMLIRLAALMLSNGWVSGYAIE